MNHNDGESQHKYGDDYKMICMQRDNIKKSSKDQVILDFWRLLHRA